MVRFFRLSCTFQHVMCTWSSCEFRVTIITMSICTLTTCSQLKIDDGHLSMLNTEETRVRTIRSLGKSEFSFTSANTSLSRSNNFRLSFGFCLLVLERVWWMWIGIQRRPISAFCIVQNRNAWCIDLCPSGAILRSFAEESCLCATENKPWAFSNYLKTVGTMML